MTTNNGAAMVRVESRVMATLDFSPEQEKMIRDTYASGCSPQEFTVLMAVARARRLNPLLKQIHFVKRYDAKKKCEVWSAQASIDGIRAIAERTGLYDGQDEARFEYNAEGLLVCAKVSIYRKDWTRPAVGRADWDEYVQTTKDGDVTAFWKRMPHVMLAKCAEAAALRKAFPEDTSGLYIPEEMAQAGNVSAARVGVTEEGDFVAKRAAQLPQKDWDGLSRSYAGAIAAATSLEALEEIREGIEAANLPRQHLSLLQQRWGDRYKVVEVEAAKAPEAQP